MIIQALISFFFLLFGMTCSWEKSSSPSLQPVYAQETTPQPLPTLSSAGKIKHIIQEMYSQISQLTQQHVLRSFGISDDVGRKVNQVFKKLSEDFSADDESLVVSRGLTRIRRASSYFNQIISWAARKAEQLTKEQCLMFHYILTLFEQDVASHKAEVEALDKDIHETGSTLKSLEKLHQQVQEVKEGVADKIMGK